MSTEMFNAASYFVDRHVGEGRGASIAIECGDRRVRYADLHERVNRTASALRDGLGVRPEERVLLLMLDEPEMVFAFFGAIKIGAVPIPVNTLWTSADYEFVLNDARPTAVVASSALLPKIADVRPRCPWVRHVVAAGAASVPGVFDFAALASGASPDLAGEPTHRDAPAFWLYSSGSTGRPKGCVHLQHDMIVCAETYARGVLGIDASD